MVNSTTVLVALGIDLAIGVGAFLIFSILRIIKPTMKYYDPRTYVYLRQQQSGMSPREPPKHHHAGLAFPPASEPESSFC